ncbi:MAG: nucleotidyltransferase [Elusimicrobia bacterium RIFCSPLOWO2_01_FULL_60_11]|nr:MAG: nucleotidyltransferase [Elusimicrobia bacterium RIFCSPLOWO2_01_FULL_60_11]
MRSDKQRFEDILEAIERIEKYAARGRDAFWKDELVQTWIVRHLQILGEAARNTTQELKDKNPQIPWSKITGMRNILVHDYFGVDREIVWAVVEQDLPTLKPQIKTILKNQI